MSISNKNGSNGNTTDGVITGTLANTMDNALTEMERYNPAYTFEVNRSNRVFDFTVERIKKQ